MPDDSIAVRAYRDGDEEAILELFGRSFPHAPRERAHLLWKYRESPFGNGRISLAFDREARLVGHYAGYPVPFRIGNRDLFAHQIGDTMTDVSVRHQGRGPSSVLGRTALDFYARFCEGEVAFNYGFNVSNIQRFSLRFLRSDRVEPVVYRVRDVRRAPFVPLSRFERWMIGCRLELVRETGPEWDELFRRVAPDYGFLVARDASWVRWRYLACPDVKYSVVAIRKWQRLIGWIVYRVEGERFLWGDALFDRRFPEAPGLVLRHLVPACPVTSVEGWFPHRPAWFDALLINLGFESRAEPNDLSLMCVPFTMPSAVAAMRESLYYTWGDGDLF